MDNKEIIASVVMPTYDRADTISRAINSVLCQSFRNYELIIIDDNSKDNTEEIVRSFLDDRIKYIKFPQNRGASAARNEGIKASKGKYVAFIDDDDEWLPEKLQVMVEALEQAPDRVGMASSSFEVIYSSGKIKKTVLRKIRKDEFVRRKLLGNIGAGTVMVVVKKKCFDKAGVFDEELKSCQDWELWIRIADHYDVLIMEDILSRVYMHDEQISTDYENLISGRIGVVRKHYEALSEFPDVLVIHLKRIGKLHCLNGTWSDAMYWFKEAVKIDPLQIIKIAAWFILEMPFVKLTAKTKEFKKYTG